MAYSGTPVVSNHADMRPLSMDRVCIQRPALYTSVSEAVKGVDPNIVIGGPASSDGWDRLPPISAWGEGPIWGTWAGDLIELSAAKNVPLDFVSSHFYPESVGDVAQMATKIERFVEVVKRSQKPDTPIVITEWSANPYPTQQYHDTAAMASFAVKTIHDVGHMATIFSLWAFSDIFEEQGWSWDVFNGKGVAVVGVASTAGVSLIACCE